MDKERFISSFRGNKPVANILGTLMLIALSTGCDTKQPLDSLSTSSPPTPQATKAFILNSEKQNFTNLSDIEYVKRLIKEYFDLGSNSTLKLASQNLDQNSSSLKRTELSSTGEHKEVSLKEAGVPRENVVFLGPIENMSIKVNENISRFRTVDGVGAIPKGSNVVEISFDLTPYGEFSKKGALQDTVSNLSLEEQSRKNTNNVSLIMRYRPSSWEKKSVEDNSDAGQVLTMRSINNLPDGSRLIYTVITKFGVASVNILIITS